MRLKRYSVNLDPRVLVVYIAFSPCCEGEEFTPIVFTLESTAREQVACIADSFFGYIFKVFSLVLSLCSQAVSGTC